MNKSELIDAVAGAADLSKADAARAVDGVIGAVTQALKSGDQVTVVGFGTFLVRQREARSGRNPRTGETIQIKASVTAAITPSTARDASALFKSAPLATASINSDLFISVFHLVRLIFLARWADRQANCLVCYGFLR